MLVQAEYWFWNYKDVSVIRENGLSIVERTSGGISEQCVTILKGRDN